jgi:hypothetical protein
MRPKPDGAVPSSDAETVKRAAADVAAGRSVDFQALLQQVQDPAALEELIYLQVVQLFAQEHNRPLEQTAAGGSRGSGDTVPAPGSTQAGDPAPPPESGPELWGRYQLLEMVGSGSFGSVYRAWDPQLEREIAIKILHRQISDAELKQRLLDEGRALAQIEHENVVKVLAIETYGDRVGLCMEFVRGETLEAAMRRGQRFNPREAVLIGEDLCRALAAVHAAGFVHRDVTAKNVMRDLSGRLVLMDFGTLLRTTQNLGAGFGVAGTPLYMAPEVLAGQKATPCSDVYSVGVLLYYLVTRHFPIEGRTLDDLRAAHMVGQRTSLRERAPDLPTYFVDVVDHALLADPRQRCSSSAAMVQALDAALLHQRATSQYVRQAAIAAIGALVVIFALGAINSRYFNHVLGRADFANESLRDWFGFGVSALVAPVVVTLVGVLGVTLLQGLVRMLLAASPRGREIKERLNAALGRSPFSQVPTLSVCVLLISAVVLVVTWWNFGSFIGSLGQVSLGGISAAPREALAFLSPAFRPTHLMYRKSFSAVAITCAALWYAPIYLSLRRRERIPRATMVGGIAVLVLSLLILDFPYRLLAQTKRDRPMVTWQQNACYLLGDRPPESLIYCPDLPVPRNRVVPSNDPGLKRLGTDQDIFTNAQKLP